MAAATFKTFCKQIVGISRSLLVQTSGITHELGKSTRQSLKVQAHTLSTCTFKKKPSREDLASVDLVGLLELLAFHKEDQSKQKKVEEQRREDQIEHKKERKEDREERDAVRREDLAERTENNQRAEDKEKSVEERAMKYIPIASAIISSILGLTHLYVEGKKREDMREEKKMDREEKKMDREEKKKNDDRLFELAIMDREEKKMDREEKKMDREEKKKNDDRLFELAMMKFEKRNKSPEGFWSYFGVGS